jgi:hypothetical protein
MGPVLGANGPHCRPYGRYTFTNVHRCAPHARRHAHVDRPPASRPVASSELSCSCEAQAACVHARVCIRMGWECARHVQGSEEPHLWCCSKGLVHAQQVLESATIESNYYLMSSCGGCTCPSSAMRRVPSCPTSSSLCPMPTKLCTSCEEQLEKLQRTRRRRAAAGRRQKNRGPGAAMRSRRASLTWIYIRVSSAGSPLPCTARLLPRELPRELPARVVPRTTPGNYLGSSLPRGSSPEP